MAWNFMRSDMAWNFIRSVIPFCVGSKNCITCIRSKDIQEPRVQFVHFPLRARFSWSEHTVVSVIRDASLASSAHLQSGIFHVILAYYAVVVSSIWENNTEEYKLSCIHISNSSGE